MTDEPLFEGYEPAPAPVVPDDLSPDRKRTYRQQQDVTNGRHPLTGGPLHPEASTDRNAGSGRRDPFTCGSCVFRVLIGYHNGEYPKCLWPDGIDAGSGRRWPRVSHGAASDVRAWWPACPSYEAKPEPD